MSTQPRLPQEVCDYIVDLLYDDPETLKRCCLVSKSWVPRTQKHLFARVFFKSADYPKWRKTFPDPTDSPSCYTQTLVVDGGLGGAEGMRYIESFSRVKLLVVCCLVWEMKRGIFDPVNVDEPGCLSIFCSIYITHSYQ